jgi:lysophospholipase L1-like esterase
MLRQSIRILTCVLAIGLTMEICARLEDTVTAGASFLGVYNHSILYDRPGPDFHGVPGASYLKWKMNSLGYRGPEPLSGALRVACVGASETFGLYEKEGGEWPRQLDRLLRETRATGDREITVINTAYAATNLRTHLHQAPRMLAAAKPDLIILYAGPAAYVHPTYYSVNSNPDRPMWHSRLAVKVRELAKRLIPPLWMLPLRYWLIERSMRGREHEIMTRISPEYEALFASDLSQLLDLYAANHVPVILVTHATRFGRAVTPEEWPVLVSWRQFYPMLREGGFIDMEDRLNEHIRRAGAARHLPVVDAARYVPPGPRYFADFVHFTDEGAAVFARLLADTVRQHPAIRLSGH